MDTFRSPDADPQSADPRLAGIGVMVERLDGTLRTAQALLLAARSVDLSGLDAAAGRLCAASLDLPPEAGRALREKLAELLARLDMVEAALRLAGTAR